MRRSSTFSAAGAVALLLNNTCLALTDQPVTAAEPSKTLFVGLGLLLAFLYVRGLK